MRAFLLVLVALGLPGCGIIYKLPTRQGNVIEQKNVDQLQVGMTRQQVQYVMGTPIASNPFRYDRWDYLGYYKSPRGKVTSRTVSVFFKNDRVARIEGAQIPVDDSLSAPDVDTVIKQEKKDASDKERSQNQPDSGVVITPNS
jgi:outer membrane protein assembly factor BamE (lipoprotein component of BamABCDE complex)